MTDLLLLFIFIIIATVGWCLETQLKCIASALEKINERAEKRKKIVASR